MKGIRGITDAYNTDGIADLQLKVIFNELKSFDEELTIHANIENDILFPKALNLEKQAIDLLRAVQGLN